MKNLSKILAAVVCAALLFALAACGTGDNNTTTTDAPTTSQPTENTDTADTADTAENTDNTDDSSEDNSQPSDTSKPEDTSSEDPHYVENKTKFDTTKHVFVTFVIKDMGEFQVELYPEYAPNTVTNFANLADSGYFDGTKFHRVVDDFMAQGGQNTEVETPSIYGEFKSNGFEQNTLHHERGVISMARANDPDSATGQFFICYTDCDFLDGNYAAFGKITYGMDVIDSFLDIERAPNSMGEMAVPQTDIIIEKTVVSQ